MKPIAVAVLATILASAALACGGGEDGPAKTVRAYLIAVQRGDASKAASLACDDRAKGTLRDVAALRSRQLDVSGIRVKTSATEEAEAFVDMEGTISIDGERNEFGPDQVQLLKEHGRWCIDETLDNVLNL